jgi:hypothetical protein
MQKWEYMTVRLDHDRNEVLAYKTIVGINDWLDGRGADGWELVSAVSCADRVDQIRLYFKRKLEPSA